MEQAPEFGSTFKQLKISQRLKGVVIKVVNISLDLSFSDVRM